MMGVMSPWSLQQAGGCLVPGSQHRLCRHPQSRKLVGFEIELRQVVLVLRDDVSITHFTRKDRSSATRAGSPSPERFFVSFERRAESVVGPLVVSGDLRADLFGGQGTRRLQEGPRSGLSTVRYASCAEGTQLRKSPLQLSRRGRTPR